METENTVHAHKPSGIRPPGTKQGTKLPQFSASTTSYGLHEITDSQTNTRAQSAMSASTTIGMKRALPAPVTQSEPKRKTLQEKAGTEFPGSRNNHVGPTPAKSMMHLRGTSIKDITITAKPTTFAAGGSRQISAYTTNSTRHGSSNSYSSSVGSGFRPPSRSQTRSGGTRSTALKHGRPQTSMAVRAEEPGNSSNGTVPPVSPVPQLPKKKQCSSALPVRKVRMCKSAQDMGIEYQTPLPAVREVSICEKLSSLSINEPHNGRNQVVPPQESPTPKPRNRIPMPSSATLSARDSSVTLSAPDQEVSVPDPDPVPKGKSRGGPVVPKTPSSKDMQQQFVRVDRSLKACTGFKSPSPTKTPFLTKFSNITGFAAFDVDERLGNFETEFRAMKDMINNSISGQKTLEESVAAVKKQGEHRKENLPVAKTNGNPASDLEQIRSNLELKKSEMQHELDEAERKIYTLERELEDEKRARRHAEDDLKREHRNELDSRLREFSREKDELERAARRKFEALKEEMAADFAKQLAEAHKAFGELEKMLEEERQGAALRSEANGKSLETQLAHLEDTKRELDRARRAQGDLNALLVKKETRISVLEGQVAAGHQELIHLKGGEQKQLEHFRLMSEEKQAALDQAAAAMREAQEAKAKLRVEESRRRKLFEQLQTLKGNIRVMCRIRPGRNETAQAQIQTDVGDYDDHIGKMTVMVPKNNYLDQEIIEPKPYGFERIFGQHEGNKVVFEEISQLVQSALDGQKVCIFCYGQTGSGKTYTMSSGEGAIIPSATKMIYEQAEAMKDAGWSYKMWGSFTEVYNEKLYDLLGKDGARNHTELRQDPVTNKYYVDSETILLESPAEVARMLETASKNRTVAATKMNRESSRSHSVFTLKLSGVDIAGNTSDGVLNLIDLAGSERVKESQVEGLNFKEAASINKSLSTLSQVMTALAEGASHIPYRNSALTKLLEGCLGGNCKTLMFVMISPLKDDLKETVSSLDFATTVSKAKPGQSSGPLKSTKTNGFRNSVSRKR